MAVLQPQFSNCQQTGVGQHKSASISLIIGSRGFQCTVKLQENIGCESFGGLRFDLEPLLQGKTMVAQHKSAHMTLATPSNIIVIATNIKLHLSCVLIVLLACNV